MNDQTPPRLDLAKALERAIERSRQRQAEEEERDRQRADERSRRLADSDKALERSRQRQAEGEERARQQLADRDESARQRHADGDKGALLDAVYLWAGTGLPLPKWVVKAFRGAYTDVKLLVRHASWDDVFGVPHKKHEKLPALQRMVLLQWPVWGRVKELRQGQPRKDHFPAVATEFGISRAVARNYFYSAEEMLRSSDPRMAALARRLASKNLKTK